MEEHDIPVVIKTPEPKGRCICPIHGLLYMPYSFISIQYGDDPLRVFCMRCISAHLAQVIPLCKKQ